VSWWKYALAVFVGAVCPIALLFAAYWIWAYRKGWGP
jgi:cbb3-type cytochrome oxidase subunit 3